MALVFVLPIASQTQAASGRRVALVIGNAAYQNTVTLTNPVNDATGMAATFTKLGFEVLKGTDLDKGAMDKIIRTFAEKLSGADVGVFFYAGHGLQYEQQNYLAPIDAKLSAPSALDFEMVRLDLVQRTMERETQTNILFLDACRDNPLGRNLARALGTRALASIGQGLAPVESGDGTLISFSTQPGNYALDGTGANSPFAAALMKYIATPGDDLSAVLINVRNDVMAATGRKQVPWDHSALTARVYFGERGAPGASGPTFEQQAELSLWASVKDAANPALVQTYLDRFPDGTFAATARLIIDKLKREAQENAAAAQREAELRKAEDARKAAEAAKVASELKEARAKQSEELKKAQEETRKAREALAKAESEREAARKAADDARAGGNAAATQQHEAELRNAEAAKRAAEAAKSASELKEANARQSEQLKKAQEETRKAREALAKAEIERETARRAAEEARLKAEEAKQEREKAADSSKAADPGKKAAGATRSGSGGNCFTFNNRTFCQ